MGNHCLTPCIALEIATMSNRTLEVGQRVYFKDDIEGMGCIVGFDRIAGVIIEPLAGPTWEQWHTRAWDHPYYEGLVVTASRHKVHPMEVQKK